MISLNDFPHIQERDAVVLYGVFSIANIGKKILFKVLPHFVLAGRFFIMLGMVYVLTFRFSGQFFEMHLQTRTSFSQVQVCSANLKVKGNFMIT